MVLQILGVLLRPQHQRRCLPIKTRKRLPDQCGFVPDQAIFAQHAGEAAAGSFQDAIETRAGKAQYTPGLVRGFPLQIERTQCQPLTVRQ